MTDMRWLQQSLDAAMDVQGHFTEDTALRYCLDYRAVEHDLDLARADHIHLVALVTLSENHLAGRKVTGGDPALAKS